MFGLVLGLVLVFRASSSFTIAAAAGVDIIDEVALADDNLGHVEVIIAIGAQNDVRTVRSFEHWMVRESVRDHHGDFEPALRDFLFLGEPFGAATVSAAQFALIDVASALDRNHLAILVFVK